MNLAHDACLRGQVAEGFAIVERARALAEASGAGEALLEVACGESDLLLKTGRFDEAAEAGLRGLRAARESGRHTSFDAARHQQRGRGVARPGPHGRGGGADRPADRRAARP